MGSNFPEGAKFTSPGSSLLRRGASQALGTFVAFESERLSTACWVSR
jgi:hypothetical protein